MIHCCAKFLFNELEAFGKFQNQKTSKGGGTLIKCVISILSNLAETLID